MLVLTRSYTLIYVLAVEVDACFVPTAAELRGITTKIKYYCDGKLSYRFEASIDGFLNLGILVVQLVNFAANLLVISNYITKSHNSDKVKITIVHGDLYNNCQIDVFEGNGYDISENISNLKGNYK